MKIIILLIELISLGWIIGSFAQVPGIEVQPYFRSTKDWCCDGKVTHILGDKTISSVKLMLHVRWAY